MSQKHDPVNHPEHYTSHPSGVECIEVVEHMTFNIGNAIKYLWRNGLKDAVPKLQDLMKARWYIDREILRQGGVSIISTQADFRASLNAIHGEIADAMIHLDATTDPKTAMDKWLETRERLAKLARACDQAFPLEGDQ